MSEAMTIAAAGKPVAKVAAKAAGAVSKKRA